MLNLPISDVETTLLVILLLIWAGLLFGGLAFGQLNEDETHRMPTWTRLLSSLTLVVAAWVWFAVSQGTAIDVLSFGIAIGMTFGFFGDIFMARVLGIEPHVLSGMAAFGLGHVAYIIGLLLFALPHEIPAPTLIVYPTWGLIALLGWYIVVFRGSDKSKLVYAALLYALLLATTAAVATNLTLLNTTFVLLMVGAILFLISDLLLAAQLFKGVHFKYIGDVVWLLYGPGQMLIVFGVMLYTLIAMSNT